MENNNTLKETFSVYRNLLESGENIEVINLFYDDEIVQLENSEAPLKGKELLLKTEKENIEKVKWSEAVVKSFIVDEEQSMTMGEMEIKFESRQQQTMILHEAFIQHWKNGKIVFQRFYYGPFQKI